MTLHQEYQELVKATRLTLLETFDPQMKVPNDFKEIHAFHKKEFPQYPLNPLPPTLDIAILSFSELPTHQTFLKMMEKALSLRFGLKAKVISNTEWGACRFIIAPDYGIWGDPVLSKNFREGEKPGKNFLGNTPLFLLTDLAQYMREPKLKASLWCALCQEIGSLR